MSSIIYFFSATGNSLKVAKDIAAEMKNTELVKVCKETFDKETSKINKKVGLIFPVYYYGLPLMVKEFVEKLQIDKNTYIYAVATCGGSVGNAISQLDKLLKTKSLTLSSAFTVIMPDNYQVMYSPPSLEKQRKLFNDEEKKIQYICEIVKNEKLAPFEAKNSIPSKLLGRMLSNSFKPKEKDKNFWSDEKCNNCGICARICPSNNIVYQNKKPKWLNNCEHCLACMHWCPKKSIQYKKGTLKRERYHHPDIKVSELYNKS